MSEENILESLKDAIIDETIKASLKESNYIIKDESILHSSQYLIYKTPPKLELLKEDGTLMNVVFPVYYSYIETNLSSGKPTIKKKVTNALRFVENGLEVEEETESNVEAKVLYELSQIEKKGKGKIKVQLEPNRLVHIQYINRDFNSYEVYFQKKDGGIEKKNIKAQNDDQVNFMANYLMKSNSAKYYKVDYIYKTDFGKSFWEKMFVQTQKRKQLTIKDLSDFTRKLYKFHSAYEAGTTKKAIDTLIASTGGNIRSTAISMANIMKENGIENAAETFTKLNEEDLRMGQPVNFDTVYLSILGLVDKGGFSFADAYRSLNELIERKVFLGSALKSAIKGPAFVLFFLIVAGIGTINMFAPILFEIYKGVGEPVPKLTKILKGGIDFIFSSSYPANLMEQIPDMLGLRAIVGLLTSNGMLIIIGFYMFISAAVYFTKNTFYGRKSMHNIVLSIPIFGSFFKRSEYEIFLTVASQLYGKGASNHQKALPILKTTLKNYHIQGVLNTASNKFNIESFPPGELFIKYPDYIDEKVANLFQQSDPDESEMATLKETYKIENDEFIGNLQGIIKNIMLMISGSILLMIIMATIMPMLELATKI